MQQTAADAVRLMRMVLILCALVWSSGTLYALLLVTPHGCAWPFRIWALTWPAWKLLSDDLATRIVGWTLALCP